MKKYLLLFSIAIVAFTGCKDDKDDNPGSAGETVPSTFTKKVVVEEFSGAWCGFCPDGANRLQAMVDNNAGRVIGVTIHQGDAMQLPFFATIDATYDVTGFPQGMVDRVPITISNPPGTPSSYTRSLWESNAMIRMQETAKAGLTISSEATGTEDYKVSVGVAANEALTGDYRVTVYLLEDGVTGTGSGYDQRNYYSKNHSSGGVGGPTHANYEDDDPIQGYVHNKTLRKVLTADLGDPINGGNLEAGVRYDFEFNTNIFGMDPANVSVVALVHNVEGTRMTHEILNGQKAKLGSTASWD